MKPKATPRHLIPTRPARRKEFRLMIARLIRVLDASAPITLVCLALMAGAATGGLGF